MPDENTETSEKIAFSELVEAIENRSITQAELETYFIADVAGEKPFSPRILINPKTVDITGVEQTAKAIGTALAQDASRAVRASEGQPSIFGGSLSQDVDIVAEGDSWFDLPPLFFPPTLADIIGRTRRILNLGKWGDELDEMIVEAEYLPHVGPNGVQTLMFSGGGNDVLGGGKLHEFIDVRSSEDTDPDNAGTYIRPNFFTKLDEIMGQWARLCDQLSARAPSARIFVHGYDFVIPREDGRWLGQSLERQGFHPVWRKEMARELIRVMLRAYNARLEALQSQRPNFVHVDLLGTVGLSQWHDELHPDRAGATKLAGKFDAALTAAGVVVPTS